jgi:hypothetical protein
MRYHVCCMLYVINDRHEVPAYQPERALELLQRYLDGSWFV